MRTTIPHSFTKTRHFCYPVAPFSQDIYMSDFDELEDGTECDYCGNPISFNDEDWAVCETCQAEYTNMDFTVNEME